MTQTQLLVYLLIPSAVGVGVAFASLETLAQLAASGSAMWIVGALVAFSGMAMFLLLRLMASKN